MTFKDKTFCNAPCSNAKCPRKMTLDEYHEYRKWSESFSSGYGPISQADFSFDCPDYQSLFEEKQA